MINDATAACWLHEQRGKIRVLVHPLMGPIAVLVTDRWKQRARRCSIANEGENGLGFRQQLIPDKQRWDRTRRVNRKILGAFMRFGPEVH